MKIIKATGRITLLLIITLIGFTFAYGQKDTSNGVYVFKTYKDFVARQPIMVTDTLMTKGNDKSDKPTHLDHLVWGMQKGKWLFRFYQDTAYLVEDTSGLIIYSKSHTEEEAILNTVWVPIPAGKLFPYGFPMSMASFDDEQEKKYFFSKTLNGKIEALTEDNVIKAVHNPTFIKAVKKRFKWYNFFITDREDNGGPFLVNEVYNQTIK